MKLIDNEIIMIELLRHFDFLRRYNFAITKLSVYGKSSYITYSSHHEQLHIEWDKGLNIEIYKGRLFMYKCINVSSFAKRHGILLDTGYIYEQIKKYAEFIKKNDKQLL